MRTILLAAATAAALSLGVATTADAAPVVLVAPAVAPPIVLVSGGCGPGFHRGVYGRCITNVVVRRVIPFFPCRPHWTRRGYRRVC